MSNFTKGQTVTFDDPKSQKPISGVLEKYTAKSLKIIFDNGEEMRSISSNKQYSRDFLVSRLRIRHHEQTPISSRLQARIDDINGRGQKFAKGDVVSFQSEGKTCTGRVIKGGSKPQVTYTFDMALNIPAHQLSPASLPETDPELAEWTVTKMTDEGMGHRFPAWSATVARNGEAAFLARCLGDGGVLRYDPIKGGKPQDISDWKAAIAAYAKSKGCETSIPDELWPEYAWEMEPTGMTFAGYLNQF